jgi:hypothetical protein
MINRVVNLTMTNWRLKEDTKWGDLLERVHHGETAREDIAIVNLRVVGPNLALPKFDTDNIFATILERQYPKKDVFFEIPDETIIIKSILKDFKTNEPKSNSYHKLTQGNLGDDKV